MTIAITGRAMKNLPMTSHFAGADASGPGDVGCGAATPGLVPVDGALLFSGGGALPIGSVDVDRKSTRLNSSHQIISYAVFCLKKKTRMSDRGSSSSATRRTYWTLLNTQ